MPGPADPFRGRRSIIDAGSPRARGAMLANEHLRKAEKEEEEQETVEEEEGGVEEEG